MDHQLDRPVVLLLDLLVVHLGVLQGLLVDLQLDLPVDPQLDHLLDHLVVLLVVHLQDLLQVLLVVPLLGLHQDILQDHPVVLLAHHQAILDILPMDHLVPHMVDLLITTRVDPIQGLHLIKGIPHILEVPHTQVMVIASILDILDLQVLPMRKPLPLLLDRPMVDLRMGDLHIVVLPMEVHHRKDTQVDRIHQLEDTLPHQTRDTPHPMANTQDPQDLRGVIIPHRRLSITKATPHQRRRAMDNTEVLIPQDPQEVKWDPWVIQEVPLEVHLHILANILVMIKHEEAILVIQVALLDPIQHLEVLPHLEHLVVHLVEVVLQDQHLQVGHLLHLDLQRERPIPHPFPVRLNKNRIFEIIIID